MTSHHTLKSAHDETPASPAMSPASALEIAARITHVIVREWDADVVMRTLVQEAGGMLGATSVLLWLTGATPDELTLAYAHSGDEAAIAHLELDASGAIGRAGVTSESVVVVADDSPSPADPLAGYLHAHELMAMLLVPMEAHGRLLGVFGIGGLDARTCESAEVRRTARYLGDLCALAVESTGLQERLRETNAHLVAASIEAQQRAEELSEEKQEREAFISLVAHELKNPLSVLTLQIALLQRNRASVQRRETALRIMAGKATQLKRLIEDLLDASHIASGHFSVEPELADVGALAHDVVQEQQATTKMHRVRLELETEALSCLFDRQRIAQALSNLISNAIKYSPAGGDIVVRITRADDQVQIAVTDHGAGLSSSDLAHLFEPYTRILRVREALGTGLGLYITKGIVAAHGGGISATSPGVGHGSTFTMTIPCGGRPAGGSED